MRTWPFLGWWSVMYIPIRGFFQTKMFDNSNLIQTRRCCCCCCCCCCCFNGFHHDEHKRRKNKKNTTIQCCESSCCWFLKSLGGIEGLEDSWSSWSLIGLWTNNNKEREGLVVGCKKSRVWRINLKDDWRINVGCLKRKDKLTWWWTIQSNNTKKNKIQMKINSIFIWIF